MLPAKMRESYAVLRQGQGWMRASAPTGEATERTMGLARCAGRFATDQRLTSGVSADEAQTGLGPAGQAAYRSRCMT